MDENWAEISDFCHYFTFDPDPRSKILSNFAKHTNYNIGLWSKKDLISFNLAKYPQASSIYKFNNENLSLFLNHECHQTVKTIKIHVNSIDNVFNGEKVDFIKLDAEGADLEILKGAENTIVKTCLGIQIEVSFINRHINAPYFSEIDDYLRKLGFSLFSIEPEKWIRKNNTFSITTNPQLIWGNAIYLLSKEKLINVLSNLPKSEAETIYLKYIISLLIYNFHDYAMEICETFNKLNILSDQICINSKKIILNSLPKSFAYLLKLVFSIILFSSCLLLFFAFSKIRKSCLNYLKKSLINLSKSILNVCRYGVNNSSITG